MPPVTHSLRKFDVGDKANIVINPSVHGGMPHRRFQGQTGVVIGSQGRAYMLEVRQGGKTKVVLAAPEHLRKQK